MKNYRKNHNRGQAVIVAVLFLVFGSVAVMAGVYRPVNERLESVNTLRDSTRSYFISESAAEDVAYRLSTGKTVGTTEVLTTDLGVATATTQTTIDGQEITAVGEREELQRKNKIVLSNGDGVSLFYGIQAGVGGFSLSGGSRVNGNVYSNGTISATDGSQITGSAIAAGSTSTIGGGTWSGAIRVGSTSTDLAWAHTVSGAQVTGSLYCQTGSANNKPCDTSRADPTAATDPLTSAMVQGWKDEVQAAVDDPITGGWTYTGNLTIGSSGTTTTTLHKVVGNLAINCSGSSTFGDVEVTGSISTASGCDVVANKLKAGNGLSLSGGTTLIAGAIEATGTVSISGGSTLTGGPIKVKGDLSVGSTALTMKGSLWVTGNIIVSSGGAVRLHSSYGTNSGYIVADGYIDLSGAGTFSGSGQTGSYPLLLSTSNCSGGGGACAGKNAIEISGGAGAVILVAQNGTLNMSGGTSARALTSRRIVMTGGASVTYESGLADLNFTSGPSGGYTLSSWSEVP